MADLALLNEIKNGMIFYKKHACFLQIKMKFLIEKPFSIVATFNSGR